MTAAPTGPPSSTDGDDSTVLTDCEGRIATCRESPLPPPSSPFQWAGSPQSSRWTGRSRRRKDGEAMTSRPLLLHPQLVVQAEAGLQVTEGWT